MHDLERKTSFAVTLDQIITLAVLLGALVLFCTTWVRLEIASLIVIGATACTGILEPEQVFLGFSNPATITIGCMFILSAAVMRSGVLIPITNGLLRASRDSEWRLLLMLVVSIPVLSAFINNTPVVILMLPIILKVCERSGIAATRILIPMSFLSMLGGTCTLIGTSTNLLIDAMTRNSLDAFGGFRMFDFLPVGLGIAAAGTTGLLVLGRFLLPVNRHPAGFLPEEVPDNYMTEVRVHESSPLVGRPLDRERFACDDFRVIAVMRGEDLMAPPPWDELIETGDCLLINATPNRIMQLLASRDAESLPGLSQPGDDIRTVNLHIAELIPLPVSPLINQSVGGARLHRDWDLNIVAVQRQRHHFRAGLQNLKLRVGDILLVQGSEEDIDRAARQLSLVRLQSRGIEPVASGIHPAGPIAILAGVIAATTILHVPIMISALIGVILVLLLRIIPFQEATASLDTGVLLLLAASIPLAQLFESSGLAGRFAETVLTLFGTASPHVVLAVLFIATNLLTQVISNNGTAVLMTPIAIQVGQALGVSPIPMVLAVAYSASCSFLTPLGYQTNAIVFSAGGYRFSDFLRIGLPITLIVGATAVLLIPKFFPF